MKNQEDDYIYEELTLDEFAIRFADITNYEESCVIDLSSENIQVSTLDEKGGVVYRNIQSFVVKPKVDYHYTDGHIKVTENHVFVEEGLEVKAQNHRDFMRVDEPIYVVDLEVDELHTYLANGRLNHNTTSGGKALPFHASCRVRLKGLDKLKNKQGSVEQIIGVRTEAQIVKNRMGPPFKKANFDIYFDSGIDDVNSWLQLLKDYEVVKQSGAWYEFVNEETGETYKFQAKDWRSMINTDESLRDYCYRKICDVVIMKYKAEDIIDPDQLILDNEIDEE